MGADAISTKHEDVYFSRNWYSWRPLWDFCYEVAPDIIRPEVFESGHQNGGLGLNAEQSRELASRLRAALQNGNADTAVANHKVEMDALPDEVCRSCNGTGEHGDMLQQIREKMKDLPEEHLEAFERAVTNGHATVCNGSGKVRPGEAWYELRYADIAAFAEFLDDSDGFEVV
jgi:hypothetical protein